MSTWLDTFLAEGLTRDAGKASEPGGVPAGEGPGEGSEKIGGGGPPSNTGGDTRPISICRDSEEVLKSLHEYRIDYLTIVVHRESENDRLVKVWLGNRGLVSEPCKAYNCHTKYTSQWDENIQAYRGDKYWVWVLPGSCRKLCEVEFWRQLHELLSKPDVRSNITRCDVTMDQFRSGVIPLRYPFQVLQHFKALTFDHAYEKHKFIENEVGACLRMYPERWRADPWQAWVSEETLYLGVRASSAYFLRCYDQHGPLRWEWEVKGNAALPMVKEIARRISEGGRIGEVVRENWIGIANRQLACDWWNKLGVGEVADPEPIPESTIETAIRASVEQYGALHLAIAEHKRMGAYLNLCKVRGARSNRASQWRAKRMCQRVKDGGDLLWVNVEKLLLKKEVASVG